MLEFLRNMNQSFNVPICIEFTQDLNWFLEFLKDFNEVTFFDQKHCDTHMELDACPTGHGGRWGNQIYAIPFDATKNNYNIAHILNILVAPRICHKDWKDQ